jgi:hypothetical protein
MFPKMVFMFYFRYNAEQKVMIVLNKNEKTLSLSTQRFRNMIGESNKGTDIISGKPVALENTIDVSPMSAMIIDCKL